MTKKRDAARDRIVSAVEELGAALADIDASLDPKDQDDMLAMYGILQDVLNVTKDAQAIVGTRVIDVLPNRYDPVQVPGGGIFKTAGGRERKRYDQSRLISKAAAQIAAQHDVAGVLTTDGEVVPDLKAVTATIEAFAALAGCTAPSFDSWRSGQAKAYGINLNDYCDLETSPITHRIEGRARS